MAPPGFWKLDADVACRSDLTGNDKVVFAYLKDRQGDKVNAWPGLRRIAMDCGVAQSSAHHSIRRLADRGMISVTSGGLSGAKAGRSSRYSIIERAQIEYVDPTGANCERAQIECGNGRKLSASTGAKCAHIQTKSDSLNQTHKTMCENSPSSIPGLPVPEPKQSQKHNKRKSEAFTEAQVLSIYEAYPKHVGKGAALVSIRKALAFVASRNGQADPVGWLLGRVVIYAKFRAGQPSQFTKHPSTWMNQQCFDDDERDWEVKRVIKDDGNPTRCRRADEEQKARYRAKIIDHSNEELILMGDCKDEEE